MDRLHTRTKRVFVGVGICILAAIVCRNLGRELPGRFFSLVRSFLYIGLFTFWGISVHRRVMQAQTRRLLTAIAGLMVFWIMERTVKYFLVTDPIIVRYLWYLYYLPMLLIPLLSVFVAASLGKPENYRLPGWTRWLYMPMGALVLLVLTNDVHQCVFSFPSAAVMWESGNSTRDIGYYMVIGSMVVCALTAVGMMIAKCRGSRGRKTIWLPLVFIGLSLVYSILYAMYIEDHTSLLYYVAGDVTVALCLLFAGSLESCLQAGLIPTNTGYDSLFKTVSVGMQITDDAYTVCYASDAARALSLTDRKRTENGDFFLNQTTLIKAYAIHGGHTIWQEDVSDLLQVREKLESTKEELQDRNELLRDQYQQDAQRYRLEEQNRLYDLVQRETQKQLREIDALTERLTVPITEEEKRQTLLRILVLATYIKRHKDMVIAADRSQTLPLHALEGALRESCSNLPLIGIGGNVYVPDTQTILPMNTALIAYDLFEEALELALPTLSYFFVTVSAVDDAALRLSIHFDCAADFSVLARQYSGVGTERSEDGWFVTYRLTGGDAS